MYVAMYRAVIDKMNETGCGLYEALELLNMKRGFWRNIRPIAEALLVDGNRYRAAVNHHGSSLTTRKANMEAAALLNTQAGMAKLRELYTSGQTLIPLSRY